MSHHTGGCLCEKVRIEVTGDPITSGVCHCGQCQRNCGGNAAALMVFPKSAVKLIRGELRYFDTVADSGNKISRGFCPNCGTPIMSRLERTDEIIIVKLGAMDDPSFFTPEVVFWTSTAHNWATFPEGTIHFPENPPPLG